MRGWLAHGPRVSGTAHGDDPCYPCCPWLARLKFTPLPLKPDTTTTALLRGWNELQRHAVDAVAQPGWRRTILEDVAEMAAAAIAVDLDTAHEEAVVGRRPHRAFERRKEARPPCPAFELPVGNKQRIVAGRARERARPMLGEERARIRAARCRGGASPGTARASGSCAIPRRSSRLGTALLLRP